MGDQPRFADVGPVGGDIVWIGQACNDDEILNAGEIAGGGIAVVRRGECTFREKNFNAAAAGADAIVKPWIYGSDRNGGLYTFREQGSGSG